MGDIQETADIKYFYHTRKDSEDFGGGYDTVSEAALGAFDGIDEYGVLEFKVDSILVSPGEYLNPGSLINSERIFEDTYGDESPEDSWIGYWGIHKEELLELDKLLVAAFDKWAEQKKLRRYYTIDTEQAVEVSRPWVIETLDNEEKPVVLACEDDRRHWTAERRSGLLFTSENEAKHYAENSMIRIPSKQVNEPSSIEILSKIQGVRCVQY